MQPMIGVLKMQQRRAEHKMQRDADPLNVQNRHAPNKKHAAALRSPIPALRFRLVGRLAAGTLSMRSC
jgi:hypothetical protein